MREAVAEGVADARMFLQTLRDDFDERERKVLLPTV